MHEKSALYTRETDLHGWYTLPFAGVLVMAMRRFCLLNAVLDSVVMQVGLQRMDIRRCSGVSGWPVTCFLKVLSSNLQVDGFSVFGLLFWRCVGTNGTF
jgi:hypothetical protein